jgi:hypothetical protein
LTQEFQSQQPLAVGGNGNSRLAAEKTSALEITFFDKMRGLAFFLWSFVLALPLFLTMMVMAPFVMIFDKFRCARPGIHCFPQTNSLSIEQYVVAVYLYMPASVTHIPGPPNVSELIANIGKERARVRH